MQEIQAGQVKKKGERGSNILIISILLLQPVEVISFHNMQNCLLCPAFSLFVLSYFSPSSGPGAKQGDSEQRREKSARDAGTT